MIQKKCHNMECKINGMYFLFEIAKIINNGDHVREIIGPILHLLGEYMGMRRCAVTIFNRETKEIFIEEAYGLSGQEKARGKYKLGEGITGKVIETGKPMVIPKISEEPQFLDRTGARSRLNKQDIAFICVPIKLNDEVIGAMSVDRMYNEDSSLQEDVQLLSMIANMLAQSIQLHRNYYERMARLYADNEHVPSAFPDQGPSQHMIGNSKYMREVYHLMSLVASRETTVLILGESGVGKEMVAAGIHHQSLRKKQKFIRVNCAAIPDNLIESELFGHERGAFTGAGQMRKGWFEAADGGTIFLDEIGDLSGPSQVRLLRVLQEKEFQRVGGTDPVKVDVRIIAATNQDLPSLIDQKQFREDLYYRLNVFPIQLPALRQRRTDITLLADFFIEKYNTKFKTHVRRLTTAAIDMLMSYHWPGNVRELENCIERAVLLSTDGVIHAYHLPPSLQTASASHTPLTGTLDTILSNVERDLIIDALKSSKGHTGKTARLLGISERILGLRLKKYEIDVKRYRTDQK